MIQNIKKYFLRVNLASLLFSHYFL